MLESLLTVLPAPSDSTSLLLLAVGVFLILVSVAISLWYRSKRKSPEEIPSAPTSKPPFPPPEGLSKAPVSAWLATLHSGLSKTRSALQASLEPLFAGRAALSPERLEELHEVLFRADLGIATADKLVHHVKTVVRTNETYGWNEIKTILQSKICEMLLAKNPALPLRYPEKGPLVILIVGVNGVGKTTSIGKLAAYFRSQNKSVLLCAGDTFRAAAIDQLKLWGERLGVDTIAQLPGSDPAAVAFDGVNAAVSRGYEVLLIDTAGRLHSKNNLMAELDKIKRVLAKALAEAPHETWLIIDATTGQNAVQQVKAFKEVAEISGIIATKLDGTAKGGILIGINEQFNLPIRFIGVGEKAEDLRPFNAEDFAASIFS